MAEEIKKTAIIDLQFDTEDIVKRIVEVKKQQESLKASTKELSKDFDKNADAIVVNGLKMKALGKEEAVLNKVVSDNQKMVKSQTGSIDQQRAQLAILTKQYNALSKEERQNTQAGQDLTKQIKSLSDNLKGQEKAVGNTTREVGNYKDSIKDAFTEMGVFNGAVGQTVQALGENLNGAIKVAKASFGSLGGFVKANVVGALLAAGAAATSFFKATGEGEDILEQLKARISGAFSGITQNFANAAKAFKDVFNGEGGVMGFINGIIAANKVMTSPEASENVRKTANAYAENVKRLQAMEDAERDFQVTLAERKLEIDRLLLTTKDLSLTDEQQIKNLERVKELEVEATRRQKEFAQVRLQNALILLNNVRDPTDDLKQAVADARIEIAKLEGESRLVLQAADNRISAQLEQQEAARERDRIARREGEKARMEYEFQQQTEATKKFYLEQDTIALKSRLSSIEALNKDEIDRTKLKRDFLEQQIADLRKFGKDTTELQNQLAQTNVDIARKAIAEELRLQQAKYDTLQNFASALQSLNSIIAGNNAEATEFGKALTAIQIGLAAAKTIGEAIASAKGVTPIDYILQVSIATAAALGAIAQVKAIYDAVPEVPEKPEFYEGGYTDSNGGYTGDGDPKQVSKVLGEKPYTYHKREYVIDHKTLETPAGVMLARMAENMRKSRGLSSTGIPGFYDGGFTYRTVSQPVQDRQLQAADIVRIVKSIPPQEVNVSKFTKAQTEMKQVRNSLDLRSKR